MTSILRIFDPTDTTLPIKMPTDFTSTTSCRQRSPSGLPPTANRATTGFSCSRPRRRKGIRQLLSVSLFASLCGPCTSSTPRQRTSRRMPVRRATVLNVGCVESRSPSIRRGPTTGMSPDTRTATLRRSVRPHGTMASSWVSTRTPR